MTDRQYSEYEDFEEAELEAMDQELTRRVGFDPHTGEPITKGFWEVTGPVAIGPVPPPKPAPKYDPLPRDDDFDHPIRIGCRCPDCREHYL